MTLYEMTEAQKQLYELMTSGEIDEEVYADTLEGIGIAELRRVLTQVVSDLNFAIGETSRESGL